MARIMKTDIKSLSETELKSLLEALGEKPFRSAQVFDWIHKKKAQSFDEMTNLSLALRERLKEEAELVSLVPVSVQASRLDGTRKYLFRLEDGNLIESVFMPYHHGNSVCVSSQAGCRMGCRFCASTIHGLSRNLKASEILEQVYAIERDTKERVSHVVMMGSGEPFDNYEAAVRFIRLISSEKGADLSIRNITVSTCGLTEGIRRFAEEDLPVTLALSLHAPNQALRESLMPVARRYDLQEVIEACSFYFETTHRRLTFEYALMNGINDSEACARELSELLKGQHAHINLIPVNPVEERDFRQPDSARISSFVKILEKNGINVTIRRTMGADIDGACGQLRNRVLQNS
ncbi:MAG: 23S rRNA (adenine(2503)-C(2))-methyltransferase RlmN [Lachnospiraceae bacterium]|nr:23S rRNA (adenine(2503)-C(2))-methyltransferase RlmN [Lachnospiraceae bacterium]